MKICQRKVTSSVITNRLFCQMLGVIMLHLLVGYHVYCICIVISFDLYTLPTSQGLYWIGVGGGGVTGGTPLWHATWVLVAAFRDVNFSNDSKRCWDIVKQSSFGHLLGVKMSQSEPCPQSKILFIYKELLETSTPHFYVGVPHTRGAGIPSTRIELAADQKTLMTFRFKHAVSISNNSFHVHVS